MVASPKLCPNRRLCAAALLAAGCFANCALAKQEPLYEFGLGVGAIAFDDYRGSATAHGYPLPLPYLLYNGKFLKANRDGIRGTLFNQDRFELNLSFDATTPVRSDRERSGMPDLKSTVELGPALDLHLMRSADGDVKLDLRMPVRAALTVEASPKIIGWTFTPRLALDLKHPFGFAGWNLGLLTGPLFADRRYHAYFYTIAPQYATPTRPAYEASGGYAGTQFISALSKRFPKFWVGAYARYDTLSGATFADSPLVQRKSYMSGGIGISWILSKSSQMVEVPD
ncbi:MAG TPA: MipA/OmpV family protein [Steroidobacteraceae bacterium]|jgi:outer membrane protein|nr:MipA/OmpV family protein [Steroidobacteraceae bacterium]